MECHLPPANRWPGYAMRKVRTRNLAAQLGSEVPRAEPVGRQQAELVEREREYAGFGGKLRGRPDIVRKTDAGIAIEDYKTGSLYEAESGELRESYRLQLLLYAALAQEVDGEHASSATLIPLEGAPTRIDIQGAEAVEAASEVIEAMDAYNQSVDGEVPPLDMATPCPDHCRFCPYSVRCPAFWATITHEWREDGIVAVAGEVQGVAISRFGTLDLETTVQSGSVVGETATLHGLPLDQFTSAAEARAGSSVAATGLRPGLQPEILRSTLRTRLVTDQGDRCEKPAA